MRDYGMTTKQIKYWFDRIQRWQDDNKSKSGKVKAKCLHKNYTRTIERWHEPKREQGLEWCEDEGGYRKIHYGSKPANRRSFVEELKKSGEYDGDESGGFTIT